jgi:hypothetical protein
MRQTMARNILLMTLTLASAAQNAKLAGHESDRILSLENAWNLAEANHDARAMNMLIADTFAYTDDDGSFMDRGEWMAHIRGGAGRYEQLGNFGMAVNVYENVAVVTGKYRWKLKVQGKEVIRSGRFTDVWIRQNVEWKCIASQATLISP